MFPIRKFILFSFLTAYYLRGEYLTFAHEDGGEMTKFRILLLNGPNLNMLGRREPDKYGHSTLPDIVSDLSSLADTLGVELGHFQTNAEHELIERIHQASDNNTDFIIINPAAFTHTSVAVRDALLAVKIPFFEVHLSNVFGREKFRHHSYLSDIAVGVISGLGADGYRCALQAAFKRLSAPT